MNDQRQQLIELGTERLADALLELAEKSELVEERVEGMLATPKESIRRYKTKLAGLRRMRRFVGWRESGDFAREIVTLLEDLRAEVDDPCIGAELVAAFYEVDGVVFDHCDDSNGTVGDVFRCDARDLFVHYAARCEDKQWLADLVLKLGQNDDYGVRDALMDCAADYLPEEITRGLTQQLWRLAERETDEYKARHWIFGIESLARQLKDAPLFEKARRAAWPEVSPAACLDIAEVYLEFGDAETALSWLERIREGETFKVDERDRLLLAVHEKLGKRQKRVETAWRIFRRHRSEDTLKTLLTVIGENQRNEVIDEEAGVILQSERLSYSDTAFLIQNGRIDDAEAYLLEQADQLDGDFYTSLLPIAEAMEKIGRVLVASVIYRALLDSILGRAQSKYYHHGVRYLKKLDVLAGRVGDWRYFPSHRDYTEKLRQLHGRKRSFWSRYGK
ncbi:MAG: DUF6880 family protein [Pseudomonadota bacterium]